MNDGLGRHWALQMHAAVSETNTLGLEHVNCPAEVVSHGAGRCVAGAFPLSDGLPVQLGAASEVFNREASERATSAQLIACDSD
jgi:hypothetical protein